MAIAGAIYLFFGGAAPLIPGIDPEWRRYGTGGILLATIPAIWYVRSFKAALDDDLAAARKAGGVPDPRLRAELLRRLSIGGALCELPLAVGVVYLLAGGERSWFVAAACVTLALRLSYRPFTREPR